MRKLVFDNSKESEERFKVLWMAHISGPPAEDYDHLDRINKVTAKFKENSEERHEMQSGSGGQCDKWCGAARTSRCCTDFTGKRRHVDNHRRAFRSH